MSEKSIDLNGNGARVDMGQDIPSEPLKTVFNLDPFYKLVVDKAEKSIKYYVKAKRWKRRTARMIRFFAIALFSIAGLIPLIDATGLFPDLIKGLLAGQFGDLFPQLLNRAPPIIPANASPAEIQAIIDNGIAARIDSGQIALVVAAIAAALIGMDKFFGLSSSWSRLLLAELSLRRIHDRFILDWAMADAALKDDDDERNQRVERLQMLKEFSIEISQINEEETKVWVSEYQNSLTALENSAKEQRETLRHSSIRVAIRRGSKVKGVVKVLLDGYLQEETGGDSVTIRRVSLGTHDIQVLGNDKSGEEIKARQVVVVNSSGAAPATLTLS